MDKKILMVIVAVVLLVVGVFLGMGLQMQKDNAKINGSASTISAVKSLSSKVVPSIIAYGQVTNISGKVLTLSYSGDVLDVKISDNSNIYSFSAPTAPAGSKTPTAPVQQKALFSDIRKGDNLNVSLKLKADGSLEGQSVIILPSANRK